MTAFSRRSTSFLPPRVAAFLLVWAVPLAALAEPAEDFVKGKHVELAALIKQGANEAAKKKVEVLFDGMLDYDALAKASLGDQWGARSDDERKDFESVLKHLVQRAYRKNLDKTADYEVRYGGSSKADAAFLVSSVAESRKNRREEPISIDYLVHQVEGRWLIRDIVTEGSSLVSNYRRQFTRIIKKDGFTELMRRMRKKLDSERD